MLETPGMRATAPTTADLAPGRRNVSQIADIRQLPATSSVVALARSNSERRKKKLSAESDLLPKSWSTAANCGSTHKIKKSITQMAAIKTNIGYCIASV